MDQYVALIINQSKMIAQWQNDIHHAIELGSDGIRVNAILPGIVSGERQRRIMEARAEAKGMELDAVKDEAFSFASIKDFVTPRQLADQILFLASPRGRMISGQAISICGDLKMLA